MALDNIPLGNDADIQKLAREFGVDAAVLTRYHFLYRTCKTSVEGGFAEPALTCELIRDIISLGYIFAY